MLSNSFLSLLSNFDFFLILFITNFYFYFLGTESPQHHYNTRYSVSFFSKAVQQSDDFDRQLDEINRCLVSLENKK